MTASMDRPREWARGWNRRARLGLAAGAIAAVGLAAAAGLAASARVTSAELNIGTATVGVFHDFVALRAEATPKDVVYLDALEGGQVQRVMAQAGDRAVASMPLVAFRNTELELEVLDREGRLVESITQLQAYAKQL
jgi:HlyD family secretion protein